MHNRRSVTQDKSRWAVILAGGDGTRLRLLTRAISGDERPKQFCTVLGKETLLQQTARRIRQVVRPTRTKVVLTRSHEQYFDPGTVSAGTQVIAQPSNCGTAPAVLYSLLSIANEDPDGQAAFFPADHYWCDDVTIARYVDLAFQAVARRPELVILLGVVPSGPEVDYGWIQPGEPVDGVLRGSLLRVRRFWEKPGPELANHLLQLGCLWNSFILIGSVGHLLRLVQSTVPGLFSLFESIQPMIGTDGEAPAMNDVYKHLAPVDFSGEVLSASPKALTVLPVQDGSWADMGTVNRVLGVVASREGGMESAVPAGATMLSRG